MLDIFRSDAYGLISLTESINRLPLIPTRIKELGLFEEKGITTTTVSLERKDSKIELLQSAARGSMPFTNSQVPRELKSWPVPHFPKNDTVMADEVQGVRAFGTEDEAETVADKVNEKLQALKDAHALTWEYLMSQVIQGKLIDGDMTTVLVDFFTDFGVTEKVVDFNFDPATITTEVKTESMNVIRHIEDNLGGATYNHVHALCGRAFFDTLINDAGVRDAFRRYKENAFARELDPQRKGFEFGDIIWEEYSARIGSDLFIPTDECRFIPIGVRGLFKRYNAPAPFTETVNTTGKPLYSKQEPMKFDVGIELHTNSNPFFMVTRPEILVKGTNS